MNRGASLQVQIVVLAAGFSSRLGQSKALVRVRGVSLLRQTVSILAPLCGSKIIVVGPSRTSRYHVELKTQPATLIGNRHSAQGLSSSVRCGIRRARHAAGVLLLPVDLARLNQRDVACLLKAWRGARRHVAARNIDGVPGTPLVLPKWAFRCALAIEGDFGLREFVRNLPREQLRLVRMTSAQIDVDTPSDLQSARRHRHAAPSAHQPG